MTDTPFDRTVSDLFTRLENAVRQRNAAETEIVLVANAIRGLAWACEDSAKKNALLDRVQELSGRVGFVDLIRSALGVHRAGLTPVEVREYIAKSGAMNLSSYTNPMASIHTSLRRLKESGELEEFEGRDGGKRYRFAYGHKAAMPLHYRRRKSLGQ